MRIHLRDIQREIVKPKSDELDREVEMISQDVRIILLLVLEFRGSIGLYSFILSCSGI